MASSEWGVGNVLLCMELNKGHKFLQIPSKFMERPPRPVSPRTPKACQYIMENDDTDEYYKNKCVIFA